MLVRAGSRRAFDAVTEMTGPSALPLVVVAMLWLLGCNEPPAIEVPAAEASIHAGREIAAPCRWTLDAFLGASARLGVHSGYVAMFARDGRVVHATAAGLADVERDRPMRLDTRFRMASMTKPVTAVAAMMLVEEGRLSLDDPVQRFVPAAADLRVVDAERSVSTGGISTVPLERPLTVRDLLTFRAGIGGGEDPSPVGRLWAERDIYAGTGSLAARVDRILGAPLYEQPGRRWRYGWSADVLARVIEVAADEPFGHFLTRRIFEPLGMAATGHLAIVGEHPDLARMYTQDESGDLVLVEHPASDALDWTPGGSGLVSTAGDFMRFALMLWNHGAYDGVRILSPDSVDLMTRAHVPSGVLQDEGIEGLGWGFGLAVVVDSEATPMTDRDGDYWWSGYYGTTFFVSPATGLVGVVLAQNQPGPYSPVPYPVYLAQAFAYFGL